MSWFTDICRPVGQHAHLVSPRAAVPARPATTPVGVWETPPTGPIAPPKIAPPGPAPTPQPAPLQLTTSALPTGPVVAGVPLALNDSLDKDTAAIPRAAQADLVMTPTTEQLLRTLAVAWLRARPALVEGPTSAGKTAAVRYLAWKTQSPYGRINLSNATEVADLLGRYVGAELRFTEAQLRAMDDASLAREAQAYAVTAAPDREALIAALVAAQREPRWVDGPVVTALKRGELLLLDEINLAPAAVVERLNSLFDDDHNLVLIEHKGEVIAPHKNFRVFATGNPKQYVGREQLSEALRSRWYNVEAAPLTDADLRQIVQVQLGALLPRAELAKLVQVHMHLADMAERRVIGRRNDGIVYTLRDLAKVARRFARFRGADGNVARDAALMRRETEEIYLGGLVDAADRREVTDVLAVTMPYDGPDFYGDLEFTEDETSFTLGDVQVRKLNTGHPLVPPATARLVLTRRTKEMLYRLMKALEMGENVALLGERACGKTALAAMYAHLRGQPYYRQPCSSGTDSAQIIGGYDMNGWNDGFLLRAGRPDGVPGVFVPDELNMASPPLLERLNPALDDDRRLVLAEKEGELVRLHPQLRFIATMNPVGRNNTGRARLSCAMHNRFTQIFVPDIAEEEEQRAILREMAARLGVAASTADRLVTVHRDLVADYRTGALGGGRREAPVLSVRQLIEALRTTATLTPLFGESAAVVLAVQAQYGSTGSATDRAHVLLRARQHEGGAA